MTSPAPPAWPRRVVVVDGDDASLVRGRNAEFLHVGVALLRVSSAAAALVALAEAEESAVVLVPKDPPGMPLRDFLDVVEALGRTAVVLGVPVAPDADIRLGDPIGRRPLATADLPVTPTRLVAVLDVVAPSTSAIGEVYRCGELELDTAGFRVSWYGRDVRLSPSGFALLEYLMAASPRTVSTEELANGVAREGAGAGADRVRARVRRVRDQLKSAVPDREPPLQTVTRVGYRIAPSAPRDVSRRLDTRPAGATRRPVVAIATG